MPLFPGRRGAHGSRLATILVVVLAVAVVGGTLLAYRDWQQRVDDTVDIARDDAPPEASGDPSDSTSASPTTEPDTPVSLWIGDGYTAGVGADSPESGASCLAAAELGWTCELDAQEGTGFVSDGQLLDPDSQPLIKRLDDLDPGLQPDVIVIDAGRNDLRVVSTLTLETAISRYLERLRGLYPGATFIEIVPWSLAQDEDLPGDLAAYITEQMQAYDGYTIDPYAEGWAGAGHTDRPGLQASDGGATQAGHAYLGERLAQAIRALDLPEAG